MVQQLPAQPLSAQLSNPSDIIYPDSDGQPVTGNTHQVQWRVTIKENLALLFKEDDNVFVAGNLRWYPVKGNNELCQDPDALVAFGRPGGYRSSYQQWKEANIAPQIVFEVLSSSSRRMEMARKLEFYNKYGVEEYYEYDPYRIELVGWARSSKSGLLEVLNCETTEEREIWVSPRLNIRLVIKPDNLEIYDPNGDRFLTFTELSERLETANQPLEAEGQPLNDIQAEKERLAAKLRGMGIDPSKL